MKNLFLFIVGGILYSLIELIFRGHTHWLMICVGGFCFLLVGAINNYIDWEMPFPLQQLIGAILITAVELISVFVLNIMLKLNIWDYSNMPLNFLGQICLPFSVGWFFYQQWRQFQTTICATGFLTSKNLNIGGGLIAGNWNKNIRNDRIERNRRIGTFVRNIAQR